MRSKSALFSLLGLLLGGCAILGSGGEDYIVRAEFGTYVFEPKGTVGLANTANGVATGISMKDLGLDGQQTEPYGKAMLRMGSTELSLSAFQTSISGSGTLSASFGGISAGAPVNSTFDLTNAKLLWRWYLIDLDVLSIGPGIGVDYFDMKSEVEAPSLLASEDFSAKVPIPVPGISAETRFGSFAAYADVYGISLDTSEVEGDLFDLEAGLRFRPFTYVDITGGYRLIKIDANGEDGGQAFDADYKIPGFFFSVAVRF